MNAITNAARVGTPLDGSSLVVSHPPCMDCARAIVQAGIKHVFCPTPDDDFVARWQEHIRRSEALFKETGIEYVWI
jgi:dCMP deaminase